VNACVVCDEVHVVSDERLVAKSDRLSTSHTHPPSDVTKWWAGRVHSIVVVFPVDMKCICYVVA